MKALPRSQLDQSAGVSVDVPSSAVVFAALRGCVSLAPFGLPRFGVSESGFSSLSDSAMASASEPLETSPWASALGSASSGFGADEDEDAVKTASQ